MIKLISTDDYIKKHGSIPDGCLEYCELEVVSRKDKKSCTGLLDTTEGIVYFQEYYINELLNKEGKSC